MENTLRLMTEEESAGTGKNFWAILFLVTNITKVTKTNLKGSERDLFIQVESTVKGCYDTH